MTEVNFKTLASLEQIDKEEVYWYTARDKDGLLKEHKSRRIVDKADGKGKHVVMKIYSGSCQPSGHPQRYFNTISSDSATIAWGYSGHTDEFAPSVGDTGVLYMDVYKEKSFRWGQFEIRTIDINPMVNKYFKYRIGVKKIREATLPEEHTSPQKRVLECITSVRDKRRRGGD